MGHRATEKNCLSRPLPRPPSSPSRRAATPIDVGPRLRVSVSPWRTILCVSLALGVSPACRRSAPVPPPAVPQVSGTLVVEGLSAPVRVARDRSGVPHIYAAAAGDLFVAQGFVQAQDRLFQMDLWRRSVQGRLAEVLGPNFIERDAMTRRMQYRGDMRTEWDSYGPDTEAIANAFVRGVNLAVDIALGNLPEEFRLAGWRPERWSAGDLLNRTDAFLASGNAAAEVLRARLVASVGAARADRLTEGAFATRADVPAGLDVGLVSPVVDEALRRVGTAPFFLGLAGPVSTYDGRLKPDPTYDGRLQPALLGSNAWAVTGSRSATGAPLLATDPHRPLAHPSLRYLVHLKAPGWNVIGAAAPWLPGVAIGHNDRMAWAMTSRDADVQDLFVERVNPANPHQVADRGRWVDTQIVADPIAVRGREKPFPFEREYTPRGVVIASDRERHLAFVLKWAGFEPGSAAELGSLALDRTQSDGELAAALARWKLPPVTVVSGSRDGGVAIRAAGAEPVRRGWNGALPAPGWTGEYRWQGWRTADGPSPSARSQQVVSANDSVARTRRLEELLDAQASFGVDDFKRMQHDTLAWKAGQLVPLLARARADRPDVEAARARLLQWDRRLTADSPAATVYVLWERILLRTLAASKVPADLVDDFMARASAGLVPAVARPTAVWFTGNAVARRDALLFAALRAAVDAARGRQDGTPAAWGALHSALFSHPLGISDPARRRFNVGPFERPGYADTVMSTGGRTLEQSAGASFSAILDVGDWDRSVATNAPGQSGSPGSPHFSDLAKGWSAGAYFQLPFSDRAVEASLETTLTLVPRLLSEPRNRDSTK